MTIKGILGAVILATSVVVLSAAAQAAGAEISGQTLKLDTTKPVLKLAPLHLACKAWGSPADFPTGILLTNDSARTVPKGAHIHWVMNSNHNKQGDYTFGSMLAHGKSVSAPGVAGGWGRGAPCTVSFVKPPATPAKPKTATMNPNLKLAKLHLACKAWGSPEEFPTGILLTNDGKRAVPKGTHVHWVMNGNAAKKGDYVLARRLDRGKSVSAPGVRGGWGRGAPCTATLGTTAAIAAKINPATIKVKPVVNIGKPHLACKAWGSPADFPTGILLTNDGAITVPKGTHIHWVMDGNAAKKGDYSLNAMLPHGKSVSAPGVAGGWGRGAPCTVSIK